MLRYRVRQGRQSESFCSWFGATLTKVVKSTYGSPTESVMRGVGHFPWIIAQ